MGTVVRDLVCASPNHESRRGQPGWVPRIGFWQGSDQLPPELIARITKPTYYCDACKHEALPGPWA